MKSRRARRARRKRLQTIPPIKFQFLFLALFFLFACARRVPVPSPIQPVPGSRQVGIASWYGKDFHGKPTASGEIYNMYDMTAAHKTLPLGTRVMVTNLENNRSIQVTINDRGPFVKNRIIDLSYAAAKAIGMVGPGTAEVMIEVLKTPPSAAAFLSKSEPGLYTLQVASFINKDNADKLAEKLGTLVENVYIVIYKTGETTYYRVRVGVFDSRKDAIAEGKRLAEYGYNVLIAGYEH